MSKDNPRASQNTDKRLVMEMILTAWQKPANASLRLGQFLCNAGYKNACDDLFYVEDFDLAKMTLEFGKE